MKKALCFFFCALILNATDVSGKWSGNLQVTTPEGDTETIPLYVELQQKGDEVSGTIGDGADRKSPIQKGKIQGAKLSFEVTSPESGNLVKFDLTVSAARLEGEMKTEADAGPVSGKVSLSRAT